jgi:hypothetical protein
MRSPEFLVLPCRVTIASGTGERFGAARVRDVAASIAMEFGVEARRAMPFTSLILDETIVWADARMLAPLVQPARQEPV